MQKDFKYRFLPLSNVPFSSLNFSQSQTPNGQTQNLNKPFDFAQSNSHASLSFES